MTTYELLKFAHVLLFGFWLGSDFGTFASSRFLMDPRRDLPTRLAFAKALLVFDLGPRVALILLLPLGLHMSTLLWGLSLSTAALAGVWVAALGWLGVVLFVHLKEHAPAAQRLARIDTAFRALLAIVLIGLSVVSVAGDGPFTADWLALKVGLFGLIVAMGVGIRIKLPAFGAAFGAIATQGSTPEREAALRASLLATYPFVMSIWVLVLTIGFLGVVKP